MNRSSKLNKSSEDKIFAGLDIGTTKICAIVGKMNKYGKLEILGIGNVPSEGVKEGEVYNIEKTIDGIKKAIKIAEDQSGININCVSVGIAGKNIECKIHHGGITRNTQGEEITLEDTQRLKNDMYKTVTAPGTKIIHVVAKDYEVDYESEITDPIGMSGVKLSANFNIITANVSAIRNIEKCIKRSDLSIQDVILEPLASSLSVLTEEEKEEGVCLVDIGGGTTDIAIFHDHKVIYTEVIPFGGNSITEDIKMGCGVRTGIAELLKKEHASAVVDMADPNVIVSTEAIKGRQAKEVPIKNLSHITNARMTEIIDFIFEIIKKSGYSQNLRGGIVLTGGGAKLQNIKQLFEYETGLDAKIGYPNEHLGKSNIEDIKSPIYSTSIGLVLSWFKSIDKADTWHKETEDSVGIKEKRSTHLLTSTITEITNKFKEMFYDQDEKI